MLTRTNRCKHKHSCYENVAFGFSKTLLYSFAIKYILSNLSYIFNLRKLLKNLTNLKANADNIRWAFFIALTNAVYKLVICLMRRLIKSEKLASIVAGFLAGLCCRIDAKSRRQLFTILLMSRVSQTVFTMGENRGYVRSIPHGEFIIWMLCNVF